MSSKPEIRLVPLTLALAGQAVDVEQFSIQCGAMITVDELDYIRPMLKQTLDYCEMKAAEPPWIGYVSVGTDRNRELTRVVGCCGFKGNPDLQDEVEIAYHTFVHCETNGFATAMAAALVEIAQQAPQLPSGVLAHTLPEENASTTVLKRNEFVCEGVVVDPEDGEVWRWIRALASVS